MPGNMKIVAVYPGKTLGGIYLASYGIGSTLVYNELAIICAVTKYAGKLGIWISHIYVDDLRSLKSGPEMWGWPKEFAQFSWEQGKKDIINVKQNGKELCSVIAGKPVVHLDLPVIMPAFGSVKNDIRWFRGKGRMDMGFARTKIQIPRDSPFSCLNLEKHLVAVNAIKLNVVYDGIQVVGHT